jgi:1-phosphatidylinositol-3-phosphate 5-kinase
VPRTAFESGGLTISCTILYPEQFDALRRTYDCEKSIVESLSRCVKWDANGGKSGSAFLKTRGLGRFSLCARAVGLTLAAR